MMETAKWCAIGKIQMTRSPGPKPKCVLLAVTRAKSVSCERTTPLRVPVVPELNRISAGFNNPSACSSNTAGSAQIPRNADARRRPSTSSERLSSTWRCQLRPPAHSTMSTAVVVICSSRSAALSSGATGTKTPPHRSTASDQTM